MKRTLIALALALGATAAVAEPTLNLQSTQDQSVWKNAPERTAYQPGTRVQPIADNSPNYSFNP
jgi:hypothetical protein